MKFANPYISTKSKLELLEKWILVHSYLYYEEDNSVIQDSVFDGNAKQLARGLKKYPELAKETKYYYAFLDYDGSTGFHLFKRLTKLHKDDVRNTARHILRRKGII